MGAGQTGVSGAADAQGPATPRRGGRWGWVVEVNAFGRLTHLDPAYGSSVNACWIAG